MNGLKSKGVNTDFIIEDSCFCKFDLFSSGKYMPAIVQKELLEKIDRKVGVESLVFEMKEYLGATNMGDLSNYLFNTPTLLDLIKLMIKVQKIIRTDYNIKLDIKGPVTKYIVKIDEPLCKSISILYDIELLQIIDGLRLIAGPNFVPVEIGITAKTTHHLEYILPQGNYPVKTGQDCIWIALNTGYLYKKPPAIIEDIELTKDCDSLESTTMKVEFLLDSFCPGYLPTMDHLSSMMSMSRRTLERTLQKENTSFFTIKNDVLQRKSIGLVTNSDLTVKEIAEYLNFSNPQNFIRSFRTWYNMSPMEYRAYH